jgi:ribosome-associated protein
MACPKLLRSTGSFEPAVHINLRCVGTASAQNGLLELQQFIRLRSAARKTMPNHDFHDFPLRGDHITLDALLKATGLAASGGDAKALIATGRVRVNEAVELRRGRKLRAGDVVQAGTARVLLTGPGPDPNNN